MQCNNNMVALTGRHSVVLMVRIRIPGVSSLSLTGRLDPHGAATNLVTRPHANLKSHIMYYQ